MNYIQQEEVIRLSMEKATMALAHFIYTGLQHNLEPVRLARPAYTLLSTGCSTRGSSPWGGIAQYLLGNQQKDGGWNDVEETIWCLAYLAAFGDRYETESVKGRNWLSSMLLPCGAWGKSKRDQPRIPITALASALVPSAVGNSGLEWLATQWQDDLASPTQLTYKGAFFLMAQTHDQAPTANDLVSRTIDYLCSEQNEDGGFGPWKGHPVGSDPWTTGVVLWGLSAFSQRGPSDVVEHAASWLQSTQLPSGMWPYHYLDDGTAMALIGLSRVLPALAEH